MNRVERFKKFLGEYKVLGLSVAFVMGGAVRSLVEAFVNGIIMPFFTPFILTGKWEEATLNVGPVILRWGLVFSALLNFLILAWIMFFIVDLFTKQEKK